jgi:DNA-binding Lrp family transcriptional regulator
VNRRRYEAMQQAYVLIETVGGKSKEVVDALRRVSGIAAADVVTGPYDVIAVAQGADANAVGRLVLNEIRGLPGISKTMTCLAVDT